MDDALMYGAPRRVKTWLWNSDSAKASLLLWAGSELPV